MNEELATYLKSKKGLTRLFINLKEKYISLGRYSGVITLKNLTKEEAYDIGNLLGYKLIEGQTLKTSYKEITKKIRETKYSTFNWQDLLTNYFNDKIITKKEQLELNDKFEFEFFQTIITANEQNKYIDFLIQIINEKTEIYRNLKQRYNKDKDKLASDLTNILLLLDNIPKTTIPLAVYSVITGNPHYLDFNTSEGNLFFKILSFIKNEDFPNTNEEKINLLSEINVYTDPLSNYVITYKLKGNDILNELSNRKEIINLNLLNILNLSRIDTLEKKVYIFENPAMLNTLHDLDVPIIITSGIPNLSLYKILEKLDETGNSLYYNGDFDPEGLLIANKLKNKFPNLKLFCYEDIDYQNALSKKKITDSRLKKLNLITIPELTIVKNLLSKTKYSAYQEKNINRIREYIENNK